MIITLLIRVSGEKLSKPFNHLPAMKDMMSSQTVLSLTLRLNRHAATLVCLSMKLLHLWKHALIVDPHRVRLLKEFRQRGLKCRPFNTGDSSRLLPRKIHEIVQEDKIHLQLQDHGFRIDKNSDVDVRTVLWMQFLAGEGRRGPTEGDSPRQEKAETKIQDAGAESHILDSMQGWPRSRPAT